MANLVNAEASSHWYTRQGKAAHEQPKKDGSGMTPTTVKHAREQGLVPSVTSILKAMANPQLQSWIVEQGIMAALTLPRLDGETLEDFAHRVVADSKEYTKGAMDLGTAIHDAAEQYVKVKALPTDAAIAAHFVPVKEWLDENVLAVDCCEVVLVNDAVGYAGRVDLIADIKGVGHCVVDFKTQNQKKDKKGNYKANCYESWPLQNVAYQRCAPLQTPHIANLVINVAAPSPCHFELWPDAEQPRYWEVFNACFTLWKYQKNYDPTVNVK